MRCTPFALDPSLFPALQPDARVERGSIASMSSATNPCVSLHQEILISASVELCETDVCFLHIQLFGTNV